MREDGKGGRNVKAFVGKEKDCKMREGEINVESEKKRRIFKR